MDILRFSSMRNSKPALFGLSISKQAALQTRLDDPQPSSRSCKRSSGETATVPQPVVGREKRQGYSFMLGGLTAFVTSLVLFSSAHAGGYGYFQVNVPFNSYCGPLLCSPTIGTASNPVLDDGKQVIYLWSSPGYVQIMIYGFSSNPGAGYLTHFHIDGCTGDGGNTHYYNAASPFSYSYSNGIATWYLLDVTSYTMCMQGGLHNVTIY